METDKLSKHDEKPLEVDHERWTADDRGASFVFPFLYRRIRRVVDVADELLEASSPCPESRATIGILLRHYHNRIQARFKSFAPTARQRERPN
jgi:hypothetical protein